MSEHLHFSLTDDRGVYHRLSRQVTDTIRYRLSRGPEFVHIEVDGQMTFEQIASAVGASDFRPHSIILSPKPVAGIEGIIGSAVFRVFCTEKGGNDALVLSMSVKNYFREVWDELFLPLLPAYSG